MKVFIHLQRRVLLWRAACRNVKDPTSCLQIAITLFFSFNNVILFVIRAPPSLNQDDSEVLVNQMPVVWSVSGNHTVICVSGQL